VDIVTALVNHRRWVYLIPLGAVVCLLLATRTFVTFTKIRIKVVETPLHAASGRVNVSTATFPQASDLRTPIALIARIESGETGDLAFNVAIDGRTVCDANIAPGTHRIDCVVTAWSNGTVHDVAIDAAATAWSLAYLELATHHGNTGGGGLPYFVILPASSDRYGRPPLWLGLAIAAVFLYVIRFPSFALPTWARTVHVCASTAVVAVIAALLISPYVSPFRVVVSLGSSIAFVCVLAAPQLGRAVHWLVVAHKPSTIAAHRLARSIVIAAVVVAGYSSLLRDRLETAYGGNYSGFLQISRPIFDANLLMRDRNDVRQTLLLSDGGGYDGQYMYIIAFDPFMRAFSDEPVKYREVVDAVPYRFGRIGFPWLTRLLAGSAWPRYPFVMVSLILVSIGVAALVLAQLAQERGMTPALGAIILFVPGFWSSLEVGLPEPLAAAFFLSGYVCVLRRHWMLAGGLFALSLLVRETGLVAVGCVVISVLLAGERRDGLRLGVVSVLPLIAWRAYMSWVLFPDWGWEGFFYHPGDLTFPFQGLVGLWSSIAQGTYFPDVAEMARAGIFYSCLLIAATAIAGALAFSSPGAVTIAAFVYGSLALCLNFRMIWVNVGNGQRGTFELFVLLAVATVTWRSDRTILQRLLAGLWAFAGLYILFLAPDAALIRQSLVGF